MGGNQRRRDMNCMCMNFAQRTLSAAIFIHSLYVLLISSLVRCWNTGRRGVSFTASNILRGLLLGMCSPPSAAGQTFLLATGPRMHTVEHRTPTHPGAVPGPP